MLGKQRQFVPSTCVVDKNPRLIESSIQPIHSTIHCNYSVIIDPTKSERDKPQQYTRKGKKASRECHSTGNIITAALWIGETSSELFATIGRCSIWIKCNDKHSIKLFPKRGILAALRWCALIYKGQSIRSALGECTAYMEYTACTVCLTQPARDRVRVYAMPTVDHTKRQMLQLSSGTAAPSLCAYVRRHAAPKKTYQNEFDRQTYNGQEESVRRKRRMDGISLKLAGK